MRGATRIDCPRQGERRYAVESAGLSGGSMRKIFATLALGCVVLALAAVAAAPALAAGGPPGAGANPPPPPPPPPPPGAVPPAGNAVPPNVQQAIQQIIQIL